MEDRPLLSLERYLDLEATWLEGPLAEYRNVLPHPSAQSRRAAPSWVPGPISSLAGLGAGAGYCARCRGGLQSLCAHISPRAPVPQGVEEFSLASLDPNVQWVSKER